MFDFDKCDEELKNDTKIDELNLLQKQLMLPGIKHKWVSRLINQKRHLNSLIRKKKNTRVAVHAALEKDGIPTGLPKASLDKKIDSSDSIQRIDQEIEETEVAIEYLEKVEHILRSMTYDVKNIIDINRLETT